MSILAGDIKLVASQVMDDVDEGGGAPTSTIIQDATSNSIFNDISELDRAGGRVNLRKVFANVQTTNVDTYLGGNVIVADAPDDPLVSVTIFKATDPFDRRTDARDRIESYLNKASVWDGYLFENHIAGQRAIQIFHREGVAPPVISKTLYLVANEGAGGEYFQYVRVTDVESQVRTFSYNTGSGVVDYTAVVTTCSLSDALAYDFPGSPPNRLFEAAAGKSKLRDTIVADAATYYGAVKTTEAIAIGDVAVNVDSIFTKLVPSAQTETALVDMPLTGDKLPMVPTAEAAVTRTVSASFAPSAMYVTPTGIFPGSLSLTIGGAVITDDGLGNAKNGSATVGTVSYTTGEISFNGSAPSASGSCTETYLPATGVSMQGYSISKQVTAENRSYVWVIPLTPLPAPSSVSLSYMAQGEWYELRDDGLGVLKGNETAYGVGTVSYVTGTVNVTLGALPDAGTEILLSWGTPQEYVPITESALSIADPKIEFDLAQPVSPSSLSISWTTGGVTKTATDNGAGAITGDATGEVYYGSGKGWFKTTALPDAASMSVEFDGGGAGEVYGTTTAGGTSWSGTLPNAPIKPKSVSISLLMAQTLATPAGHSEVPVDSRVIPATVIDDGSGGLILVDHGALAGSSVNYTTGAIVLPINELTSIPIPLYVTVTVPPVMIAAG